MSVSLRVTVVLPFLNGEPFLAETIESVLSQTFPDWELLLVDDGSSDGSTEIALRYADHHPDRIRYLEHPHHENRGVCASRNLGVREARGELIALLDADDVWFPNKLEEQVTILEAHPEAGMVYGHSEYWRSWNPHAAKEQGNRIPPLGVALDTLYPPGSLTLLLYPIGKATAPCPSDLLLRKELVERIGGFEERFHHEYQLYEDQAFLSKVYLATHVYVSAACWDRYRLHPASCDARALGSGAYERIRLFFFEWFDEYLRSHRIRHPEARKAVRRILFPSRHPVLHRLRTLLSAGTPAPAEELVQASGAGSSTVPVGGVRLGSLDRLEPISRRFGYDRGTPIDRHYIEHFLDSHRFAVRGAVLEIGDDAYTRAFGDGRVRDSDVLNVSPGGGRTTIVADLAAAPQIASESFDCIILTQTLQYLFDLRAAVDTIHRILRPGGVALITVPGITPITGGQITEHWYWGFSVASVRRLLTERFDDDMVDVRSLGNVLSAIAFLHGLAAEELPVEQLGVRDPAFQVIVTAAARKSLSFESPGGRLQAVEALTFEGVSPLIKDSAIVVPGNQEAAPLGELPIEGWIETNGNEPLATEVFAEDDRIAELRVVPEPGSTRWRFEGRVDAESATGGVLRLEAVFQPGSRVQIGEIRLTVEPTRLTSRPLVSIVIPCFNQAGYLRESIGSVLRQSYENLEIIVIDDGSTDETSHVAAGYDAVKVVRQSNQGLAAARNRGLHESSGEFLVFLDADDRLRPAAIEEGLRCFEQFPDSAIVFGRYSVITEDGLHVLTTRVLPNEEDPYRKLLKTNYITMHGAVMYRREVFDLVGEFDPSLRASEDYDMYFRVARRLAIRRHSAVVAEVRKHTHNMTADPGRMLHYTLLVLRRQWAVVEKDASLRRSWLKGLQFWRDRYGTRLVNRIRIARSENRWIQAARDIRVLLRRDPERALHSLWRSRRSNVAEFVASWTPVEPPRANHRRGRRSVLFIEELGIRAAQPGQGFNVQPDGQSALWIRCRNASERTVVVFDGVPLETTVESPSLVTATVPRELYAAEGRYPVYLMN